MVLDDAVIDGKFEDCKKWDLVAWPQRQYGEPDMVEFLELRHQPHLNGQPMKVGYVRRIHDRHVMVEEAKPTRGGGAIRQPVNLGVHGDIMQLTPVKYKDIVARKEREHNDLYQEKKAIRERTERRFHARLDWRELPAWKRWVLYLTMSKGNWIENRMAEIKEEDQ